MNYWNFWCLDMVWPGKNPAFIVENFLTNREYLRVLPDLSPCDYFLWSYVKSEVFKHWSTTIDEQKAAICKTINEIPGEMTQSAMKNFGICLKQCIAVQGSHLEDVIFKKIVYTKWQLYCIVNHIIKYS